MDHKSIRQLISTYILLGIGSAALSADAPNIVRAQEWLGGNKQAQYEILSRPYNEIPTDIINEDDRRAYQIGEALFRSPTLLGGQAAKARISCNSCHINGRGNSLFQFSGISGQDGTADVSSSFFSSFRGNQKFDPVPIPDLAKINAVSHDPNGRALEIFIKGLIVEEFNGKKPPKAVIDALAIYVRTIRRNGAQSANENQNILTVHDPIIMIDQIVDNLERALFNDQEELANLLIDAGRHQLGLIYERYKHPRLKKIRLLIIQSSNRLAAMRNPIKSDKKMNRKTANEWKKSFKHLKANLIKQEEHSLYNQKRFQNALQLMKN